MYNFRDNKRYNTYVGYFKEKYGERLQKLVVDAGFTCPNRDGTAGTGGCTYCDNAAFHPAYSTAGKTIIRQLDEGIGFHKVRYRNTSHYLAYFQPYSNTYSDVVTLRERYSEALSHPDVVGIVIGTRPDCIDDGKLDMISSLKERSFDENWVRTIGGKDIVSPLVIIEYGIESVYDATLGRINRGHDFECARRAVEKTAEHGIDVGAHFIFGLPGESREMMVAAAPIINDLPLHSVKFHQLQIVKNTRMEREYAERPGDFQRFTLDEYLDFIVDVLERLRPDLYIERIAGEVPPRFVNETPWGLVRNFELLRMLDRKLESRSTFQGKKLL